MSDARSYVSGGHVYCRIQQRDMEVEACLGCARLKQLNAQASPPYLVCESKTIPTETLADPEFLAWWHQHHRRAR